MANLRWKIKYGVLKRKYNVNDVKYLMQYLDAKLSDEDVEKLCYLRHNKKPRQIKEMLYIYGLMKGGNKKK